VAGKDVKDKIELLRAELAKLTKFMDVPCYHYTSTKWLLKNMKKRNETHPNYKQAKELLDELAKLGG
jgi:hypothetical protein